MQGDGNYSRTDAIYFIEKALSTGWGTIGVRGIVPNADGKLRPGMFGQLQLAASAPQPPVMVPDTALVPDRARRVVYVMRAKDVVQPRPVTLGPVIAGLPFLRDGVTRRVRVVAGGLKRPTPCPPATGEAGR